MKIYRRTGRAVEKRIPNETGKTSGRKTGAENDVNDRIREKEREMKKAAYGNGTAYIGNSETEESATTEKCRRRNAYNSAEGRDFRGYCGDRSHLCGDSDEYPAARQRIFRKGEPYAGGKTGNFGIKSVGWTFYEA